METSQYTVARTVTNEYEQIKWEEVGEGKSYYEMYTPTTQSYVSSSGPIEKFYREIEDESSPRRLYNLYCTLYGSDELYLMHSNLYDKQCTQRIALYRE